MVGWMAWSISSKLVVLAAAPSLNALRSAIDVALTMSSLERARTDWFASKYGSLKSTAWARSGRMDTWAMWKSKSLGPGAKEFSNTALAIQSTLSGLKPMWSAMAYVVAPSKPSIEYGSALKSASLQGEPPAGSLGYCVAASPPHQGGNAGMSVLRVSRPG